MCVCVEKPFKLFISGLPKWCNDFNIIPQGQLSFQSLLIEECSVLTTLYLQDISIAIML